MFIPLFDRWDDHSFAPIGIEGGAALYRGRVNTGFQAVATFHDGPSAPSPTYPNMLWFDSGTGTVKQRNPANTGWNTLGTIGPPLIWTNVVVPPNELTTGDAKITLKTVADAGWVMMCIRLDQI